jgi:two-component system, chemotaxis family, chemotaxis protein CheY
MAKLLVADDSAAMRKFLVEFLEDEHEVIVGCDGLEATWLYREQRPDAVLLDINMPIMTGIEALQKIKLIDPAARVAMLTGERDQEVVMAAMTSGALDFVGKPYTRERVAAAVESLLKD